MTLALLNEAASAAATAKEKAFRQALLNTRTRLISGYEADALKELDAALKAANERIKARIALAYAENPEDWSYAKMLATGRLENLQANIDAEMAYLNNGAKDLTNRYATYAFLRDIEKTAEILDGVGISFGAATVDMNVVNFFVNYPVNGTVFGERFAAMTAAMQAEARKAMVSGLVAGDGVKPITRAVMGVTDLGRSAAETVIRTTMMNASNQAHAYVYEKAGIEQLEIDATLDANTCAACMARDGKRISVKDAASISLHPNCRCVGVPVTDWPEGDRRGKDYSGDRARSTVFPADMTGMDYLKQLPLDQQEQVLGRTRVNMLRTGDVTWDGLFNRKGELKLLAEL